MVNVIIWMNLVMILMMSRDLPELSSQTIVHYRRTLCSKQYSQQYCSLDYCKWLFSMTLESWLNPKPQLSHSLDDQEHRYWSSRWVWPALRWCSRHPRLHFVKSQSRLRAPLCNSMWSWRLLHPVVWWLWWHWLRRLRSVCRREKVKIDL